MNCILHYIQESGQLFHPFQCSSKISFTLFKIPFNFQRVFLLIRVKLLIKHIRKRLDNILKKLFFHKLSVNQKHFSTTKLFSFLKF